MVTLLDAADVPPSGFGTRELGGHVYAAPEPYEDVGTDSSVDLRTALDRIETIMPLDRTVVPDGGRFLIETWRRVRVLHPDSYVHAVSFGALGSGMAVAIGAAFGRPGHLVLHITGDGGFMMGGMNEFATAVREGVDLVVVVLNDSAYGAEHVQLMDRGLSPRLSQFDWPDFALVASALGGQGVSVRAAADLDQLGAMVLHRRAPLLIDVRLDPNRVPNEVH
jgi:thiamine pyrophosphate-dependent acetolactate synthase large subunit-like protein